MHFDDRLATVLRLSTGSERAARTQYLQLLDLLGSAPEDAGGVSLEAAYERIDRLGGEIPAKIRADLIRQTASRLRNPQLVRHLAGHEPAIASATMASANLPEDSWLELIPALPIGARGFLRNRQHTPRVEQMLERLGVSDRVLPEPDDAAAIRKAAPQLAPKATPTPSLAPEAREDIGKIVERIEAFRKAREAGENLAPDGISLNPRLPLGDREVAHIAGGGNAFDFSTDASGKVIWADPGIAPMVYGMNIASHAVNASARLDQNSQQRMQQRLPISGGTIELSGAAAITGGWHLDASPHFARPGGAFAGYRGRMRRIVVDSDQSDTRDSASDRIRQLLHELRTPVNAIQGFAEVIQQQVFGPAPHEYRAMAATIAGDAARMLAGFDEIDRLAKLESGALEASEGRCDLYTIAAASLRQIAPVLNARNACFALDADERPFPIALDATETERMLWRISATIAVALGAGETGKCQLDKDGDFAVIDWSLPATLQASEDLFDAEIQGPQQSLSASMFGSGFALRLARAEAESGGGELTREGDSLVLSLPLLTGDDAQNSEKSKT